MQIPKTLLTCGAAALCLVATSARAVDTEAAAGRMPPDPGAISRLAATPFYNALMRTTWVATMVEVGHAENALL